MKDHTEEVMAAAYNKLKKCSEEFIGAQVFKAGGSVQSIVIKIDCFRHVQVMPAALSLAIK